VINASRPTLHNIQYHITRLVGPKIAKVSKAQIKKCYKSEYHLNLILPTGRSFQLNLRVKKFVLNIGHAMMKEGKVYEKARLNIGCVYIIYLKMC